MFWRIIAAIVLLAVCLVIEHTLQLPRLVMTLLFAVPLVISGYDVFLGAVRHILSGQMLDEDFLMSIAAIGAMAVGEYTEGAAVMTFFQVGELFQSIATTRSRKSVAALMDIRPDVAAVLRDGQRIEVSPEEVEVGELIEVRPGEKIPIDGEIVSGESTVDTAALTGESLPREVQPGDGVLSGCVNLSGVLTVRTVKPFGESTVSRILELVENAAAKKARAENFITRFARVYTPIVVGLAVGVALVPPLVTHITFSDSIMRALNFLVVSCPCALVISVPMSFFGGIGGASKAGVLIKGGSYMETLSEVGTVIFDKTGTLTKGEFSVTSVNPVSGITNEDLLTLAAAAEQNSNHPIARSVLAAADPSDLPDVGEYHEISGKGIRCTIGGETVLAGNAALMEGVNGFSESSAVGTTIYAARNGEYLGAITLGDTLKPDSKQTIAELKQMGIRTVILTGDSKAVGEAAAAELGVDEVHTELMPADKVALAEKIIADGSGKTAFAGDGINDAPVLSRADVGIAMGAYGADAAIEAADIVLMNDRPSDLIKAVRISRKTLRIVKENIWFAIGVKVLVLITSALGFTNMWAAVFADVGVCVLAILNAMRALNSEQFTFKN